VLVKYHSVHVLFPSVLLFFLPAGMRQQKRPIIPPERRKKPFFDEKSKNSQKTRKKPRVVDKPPFSLGCPTKYRQFGSKNHFNQSLIKGGPPRAPGAVFSGFFGFFGFFEGPEGKYAPARGTPPKTGVLVNYGPF